MRCSNCRSKHPRVHFRGSRTCKKCRDQRAAIDEQKRLAPYAERDAILLSMGFYSYGDYLQSPLWKAISSSARFRAKNTCSCCDGRGWIVHHEAYDRPTMEGKRPGNLKVLCNTCHEAAEIRHGIRRGLGAANGSLKAWSGFISPPATPYVPSRKSLEQAAKREAAEEREALRSQ